MSRISLTKQSFEPLHNLLAVIKDSITTLETAFSEAQLQFPSLSQPYQAANGEQLLVNNGDVHCATVRITAACEQLIAKVRPPMETICDAAMGYNLAACLAVAERANVVEILRKANSRGMHAVDIALAAPGKIEPYVLSRVLRLLASHHFLNEVKPDRFTNNRISSFLDTGKDVDFLNSNPHLKYDDTNGVAALVGLCTDEIFKASSYLPDSLGLQLKAPPPPTPPTPSPIEAALEIALQKCSRKARAHISLPPAALERRNEVYQWRPHAHERTSCPATPSAHLIQPQNFEDDSYFSVTQPKEQTQEIEVGTQALTIHTRTEKRDEKQKATAFNLAYNTSEPYFSWLEKPEQEAILRRSGVAMRGTSEWEMGSIVEGFDWTTLSPGCVVVDVGGGIGSACKTLMAAFPHLRFVVQDRPKVIEVGEQIWQGGLSRYTAPGTLTFESHDFFTPQKLSSPPAVFLLRAICQDWPDNEVLQILTHLRRAASPETLLILGDHIMPFACVDDENYGGIPGAFNSLTTKGKDGKESPLLPNLGRGSASAYLTDICMQVLFGSQERTLNHTILLTRRAGWNITRVNRTGHSLFGYLILKPTGNIEVAKRGQSRV